MATTDHSPVSSSPRFSGQFQPDSNLDLVNTDQAQQANQEVIAFLEWLDRKQENAKARESLDQ